MIFLKAEPGVFGFSLRTIAEVGSLGPSREQERHSGGSRFTDRKIFPSRVRAEARVEG
jgi:hypothetical protein